MLLALLGDVSEGLEAQTLNIMRQEIRSGERRSKPLCPENKIAIPEPIEHIDCKVCALPKMRAIIENGRPPYTKCKHCHGESVLRADGKPVLQTTLDGNGSNAQFMRATELAEKRKSPNEIGA